MVTRSPALRVRKARLAVEPEFEAYLAYYPAGLQQEAHEHSGSQFSMVLAGSLVERVEGRDHSAGPGQLSVKPRGTAHADSYGRHGALLLSFQFRCEDTAAEVIGGDDWHWRLASRDGAMVALDAGRRSNRQSDLLWDVLSTSRRGDGTGVPPDWLRWARSQLDCADGISDIARLAAEAGVHRVHFSRQFARHFGLSPCAYRQRQMAARALHALVDGGLPPAVAAHDAGFVDQSHMARAIRASFGTTPGRMAALLGG